MAIPFTHVPYWGGELSSKGWWHSFELPDGSLLEGVNTLASLKNRIGQFPIPQDLRGKRVLDIGAWDGWFSFEMERRGAEVVSIDNWDNPRFREMHAIYNSKIDYRILDMYDLTPSLLGRFDIVLFMGVLYHLKHPLLALERVCALTNELACVDSFVLREPDRPLMEFYETREFGGQFDNWCAPSIPCLLAFCRTAGFARVELRSTLDYSACVACWRRWEEPGGTQPAPALLEVTHNTNHGINFYSRYDEYITAILDYPPGELTIYNVKPEVSGFGVRPIFVQWLEGYRWQVNFKLPPVYGMGWHKVAVRAGDSVPGNTLQIAVDLPAIVNRLVVDSISDGTTWERGRLDLNKGDALSLWISGLPENADRNNLKVTAGPHRLDVVWMEPPKPLPKPTLIDKLLQKPGPTRQVNIRVPAEVRPGTYNVTASMSISRSRPVQLVVITTRDRDGAVASNPPHN